MDSKSLIMYLAVGLGLIFLLPAADSIGPGLAMLVKFLVVGYWAFMGICFVIYVSSNLFADFAFGTMMYNLWLFCSLMCVAIGVLAIVDVGLDQANWALWLIIYGGSVGYLKRKEL